MLPRWSRGGSADNMAAVNAPAATATSDTAFELRGVSKSFDGGASYAVRCADLAVPRGSFVALVGGSGSGKTTTLKAINRLIEPDAGEVLVGGQSAHALLPHELRRRIGYVFQHIGLFPHLTVAENIAITPRLSKWREDEVAARTRELLDLIGLSKEQGDRLPATLSGGQRQRVGVARALAAKPSIMLMDEPFGSLDPVTRDTLGTEYRRLHERLGLTTLMVTHDVLEALLLADRIVVMNRGEIIADATPHALMTDHPDPVVRALVDTPRRQAERVRALVQREPRDG
jgi:osmoprotectant transport system ATP-binding protein